MIMIYFVDDEFDFVDFVVGLWMNEVLQFDICGKYIINCILCLVEVVMNWMNDVMQFCGIKYLIYVIFVMLCVSGELFELMLKVLQVLLVVLFGGLLNQFVWIEVMGLICRSEDLSDGCGVCVSFMLVGRVLVDQIMFVQVVVELDFICMLLEDECEMLECLLCWVLLVNLILC